MCWISVQQCVHVLKAHVAEVVEAGEWEGVEITIDARDGEEARDAKWRRCHS